MKTLTERLNMQMKFKDGAWNVPDTRGDINWYDTLCLMCAELDIDLKEIDDDDFASASYVLSDFAKNANEESGFEMSIWFD